VIAASCPSVSQCFCSFVVRAKIFSKSASGSNGVHANFMQKSPHTFAACVELRWSFLVVQMGAFMVSIALFNSKIRTSFILKN